MDAHGNVLRPGLIMLLVASYHSSLVASASIPCTFSDGFCPWNSDDWKREGDHVTIDTTNKQTATLSSTAVPTESKNMFCLRFQFKSSNAHGAKLYVFLQQANTLRGVWGVTLTQASTEWTDASDTVIPTGSTDFQIVFMAQWDANQHPAISLRNVKDESGFCSKTPSNAIRPADQRPTDAPSNHKPGSARPPSSKAPPSSLGCRFHIMTLVVWFLAFRVMCL